MRLPLLAVAILLAGCFTPASDAPPTTTNATAPTGEGPAGSPTANASAPSTGMGERAPTAMERFYLKEDHTLGVIREDTGEIPSATVRETAASTAFYQSFAQGLSLTPWTSEPFRSAWESTGDIEITIRFTSSVPAASTMPSSAGFPPVGAWLGTPERYAFFLLAQDAPQTLEPNKEYSVTLVAKPPQGGFFVREGEQLALYTFLAYATADGNTASYIVGGPEPAGILLPHSHFNLTAPRATTILEEAGELPPNPGPSGDMMESPPEHSFSVPPDALFVVGTVTGAPKVGTRADIDLHFVAGGESIASGSSSHPEEIVMLGPGNLQAYGRELVARITGSGIPAGGTYSVKIVAYSP